MKASNVLKLNEWVQRKRQWITLEQPLQEQIAARATTDLEFKVSTASLRDVLLANDIKTRRQGKTAAQIAGLQEQVEHLTSILIKIVTASTVPDWLREELITEDLTEEVKAAVQQKAVAA